MAYISSNTKEDAQDDTLRFLAAVVWNAADAIRHRNPETLYTECNIAYMTFKARLKPEQVALCKEMRREVQQLLYGSGRERDTRARSRAMDKCSEWYELICEYLTERGILLRLEANLNEIVARRSG